MEVNNSPGSINDGDVIGTTDHGTWEQADTQYSNIGSAMTARKLEFLHFKHRDLFNKFSLNLL